MKVVLLSVLVLLLVSANSYCINICNSGQARAVIVSDPDSTAPERMAAKELSKYLTQITGANYKISVSKNAAINKSNKIYVGRTKAVEKLLPGFKWDKLSNDGVVIKTVGNNLILAGGRPRGTLYAVYTLLEDYLGCRWWTNTVSDIPKKKSIKLDKIDYMYVPKLIYRESHYKQSYDPAHVDFAVKLKLNGVYNPTPAEWGGHISFINGGHSFGKLIPAGQYFAQHPEWFSMIGGRRVPDGQLCLTNKEMRKEIIKRAIQTVAEDPNSEIVDVSQNDNGNYCQCPECTAVAAKYGGQSGLLIDFINEIAREVAKQYPKHYVQTFAYQYTRFAPKNIKPEPNVIVRLCSIENDNSKPLTSDTNKDFYEALNEWYKISNKLFIWDYIANFSNYHIPHPNTHIIEKNIKLFVNAGAVGMFAQGDLYNDSVCFSHVRNWVISKLLWNPSLDGNELMRKFMKGYYGKSAGTMKRIMNVYSESVLRANYRLTCYNRTAPYYTAADYKKAFALFNKALSEADSQEIRDRIDVQRKGLQLALLLSNRSVRKEVLASGITGIDDINKWCEDYIAWTAKSDNNFISEGQTISLQYFKNESIFTGSRGPAPESCKGLGENDWFDWQDDGFGLVNEGTWTFREKDPKASDGSAVRMPCNHDQWATKFFLTPLLDLGIDKAEIFVRLRKEKDTPKAGFMSGIFDLSIYKETMSTKVEDEEITTEYKDFSLGTHSFADTGQQLWVSPINLGNDNSIYIDRIYFIKDGALKKDK